MRKLINFGAYYLTPSQMKRLLTILPIFAFMAFSYPEAKTDCTLKSDLVNANKSIRTVFKGEESIFKVKIKINKNEIVQGFAKYEDMIPEGFSVSNLSASFGKAELINNRIRVIYLSVPSEEMEISYLIKGSNTAPIINGRFSFLNDAAEKSCLTVTNF